MRSGLNYPDRIGELCKVQLCLAIPPPAVGTASRPGNRYLMAGRRPIGRDSPWCCFRFFLEFVGGEVRWAGFRKGVHVRSVGGGCEIFLGLYNDGFFQILCEHFCLLSLFSFDYTCKNGFPCNLLHTKSMYFLYPTTLQLIFLSKTAFFEGGIQKCIIGGHFGTFLSFLHVYVDKTAFSTNILHKFNTQGLIWNIFRSP